MSNGLYFAPLARKVVRERYNVARPMVDVERVELEEKYTQGVYEVPGRGDYWGEKESRLRLSDEG